MIDQRVPRLTLHIPTTQPLLSDEFKFDVLQSVITDENDVFTNVVTDGSMTAPVFALSQQQQQRQRRFSFSIGKPDSGNVGSQNVRNGNVLSRALSRTLTLTSILSTSVAVDEWKRIFDKLDLVNNFYFILFFKFIFYFTIIKLLSFTIFKLKFQNIKSVKFLHLRILMFL